MHGHGDCPGCIQPLVGHDADCEVMSEKVVPRYEQPGTRPGRGPGSWVNGVRGVAPCACPTRTFGVETMTVHLFTCTSPDAKRERDERVREMQRQASPAHAGAPQIPPEPQDTGKTPAARIRERIAEKRSLYEHYHQHTKRMWEEHDAHGGWDSFINGSEVSNRIDELEWCLAVIEGREP